MVKKEHYVPQMYLRNFCIEGDENKCFEYNEHVNKIRKVDIKDICAINYLYEIRNEDGMFLFPERKNDFEIALSKIEQDHSNELRRLYNKIRSSRQSILLDANERENLLGFVTLMILRNPITRDTLAYAFETVSDKVKIKKKEEKSVAWMATMGMIDRVAAQQVNPGKIAFMKTTKDCPFITSSFPMWFTGNPIYENFYMPLTADIAMALSKPKNLLENLNRCILIDLTPKEVEDKNLYMITAAESIISNSEEQLKRSFIASSMREIRNIREHSWMNK